MISIDPPAPHPSGGLTIVSIKITVEVEQLQFIPSYEDAWESEQRRRGAQLAAREEELWRQEQALIKALKNAETNEDYEEYERLADALGDVRQEMTDIQRQLDGSAAPSDPKGFYEG